MGIVLRPLPLVYACAGCAEFGFAAPRVGQRLEQLGRAQMAWLGARHPPLTSRWPVYSLDACERGCARAWLAERRIAVQGALVLSPLERLDPEGAADRIAAAW